ncbi:MAG: rhomboid family intramembrane serine protease [Butyrivibrio sp.]|nr:rhomboid family intramembrane serine protease [Butyrivibrio sp.]
MQEVNASRDDFWERQERIYKSSYISLGLMIVNIIIFIITTTVASDLFEKGAMVTARVVGDAQFYRLFSAMFLHADTQHLMSNMLMLALAGAIVENYTGHLFFIFLYLMSGLAGNMISMAYEIRNSLDWLSVGASGAIMGLVGFIVVWITINRKRFITNRNVLLRLLLLGAFVVQACFFQPGANTAAHLGGFLSGLVLGIINIVILKNDKVMEGLV